MRHICYCLHCPSVWYREVKVPFFNGTAGSMTTRLITLATTVGYFKWLPCWHSMGKSDRITVFNMLSPTNCKKDILPKYNSWPQSKMMIGAKTIPVHCR